MPRIFDNIDLKLLPILQETLKTAERADFCVGYFNLRGWRELDGLIEQFPGGEAGCCRLIAGMQKMPREQIQSVFLLTGEEWEVDQRESIRLKKRAAQEFREQLTIGAPTNEDDAGQAIGLTHDYNTLQKKNRDGFELWLMNDLFLKEFGKAIAPYIQITFHTLNNQDPCKVVALPARNPVYTDIRDKSGQPQESFFIRTGNATNKLGKPSQIAKYISDSF